MMLCYECMKIIYVNCGVKNYMNEDHRSYIYIYRIYSNKRPSWRQKNLISAHPTSLPLKLKLK